MGDVTQISPMITLKQCELEMIQAQAAIVAGNHLEATVITTGVVKRLASMVLQLERRNQAQTKSITQLKEQLNGAQDKTAEGLDAQRREITPG